MRFFFHVIGVFITLLDDEGEHFDSSLRAIQEAIQIASELKGDSEFAGCYVAVLDERRIEIAQIPI